MLEDVDVTVFGATEKDPTRTIRGKHCTYDQETNDFECNGDVHLELDERTSILTDELLYNHAGSIATAPHRAYLVREGTSGQADRFEYGVSSGLLKLYGNVKIDTEDRTQLQSDEVIFQQKENWTTMSGVFTSSRRLRGFAEPGAVQICCRALSNPSPLPLKEL